MVHYYIYIVLDKHLGSRHRIIEILGKHDLVNVTMYRTLDQISKYVAIVMTNLSALTKGCPAVTLARPSWICLFHSYILTGALYDWGYYLFSYQVNFVIELYS